MDSTDEVLFCLDSHQKDAKMAAKLFMVLTVLFVDLSPCFGQKEGTTGAKATGEEALSFLNEAVQFIVGPKASPDQELIDFAKTQGATPTSMTEMLPYLGHMKRIAHATYGTSQATDLDIKILQRAIQYISLPKNQRVGGKLDTSVVVAKLLQ